MSVVHAQVVVDGDGVCVQDLESPTPRWTTFDGKLLGAALPTDVPASIQERAIVAARGALPRR